MYLPKSLSFSPSPSPLSSTVSYIPPSYHPLEKKNINFRILTIIVGQRRGKRENKWVRYPINPRILTIIKSQQKKRERKGRAVKGRHETKKEEEGYLKRAREKMVQWTALKNHPIKTKPSC